MSKTPPVKSHDPTTQNKPSKTKGTNIDALNSPVTLKHVADLLGPLIEFHKVDEEMTMDDVKIYWDVRAIRGKDTPFAQTKGSRTLKMILAPSMMIETLSKVEQVLTDNIIRPMGRAFLTEVNRVVAEEIAAQKAALDSDDLTEADLR